MLSIANILVPVVFSERCAWAARFAARLAKEFGSQLLVLNVGPENHLKDLEAFVSNEVAGIPHKLVVIDGDPADRIVEFAREVALGAPSHMSCSL